jgi:hypothetical protein
LPICFLLFWSENGRERAINDEKATRMKIKLECGKYLEERQTGN